ncbi:MAG: 4-hydroxy-2-oxovalerate aldolase, partial [Phyllobacteriaceae bacterium]|nr:4-hydroxy-2-oxovalerate aldolase [Phyllobacteriaceae bacterium]
RTILAELGRRRMVGGQEDMIIDVALDILKSRGEAA